MLDAYARRQRRGLFLVPALALGLVTGAFAASTRKDEIPPTVLMLSAESQGGQLVVRVRVVDPSGPGEALLHVGGPHDQDFRTVPMNRLEGDDFGVRVPFGGGTDRWLVYYVEATDRHGNGPGLNGSAEEPFYAYPAKTESALVSGRSWSVALILAPSLLLLTFILYQPGRRRREQEFWLTLLAPISATPDGNLEQAIADLCTVPRHHPERGLVSVTPQQALRWLGHLKTAQADRLKQARERHEQIARHRPVRIRSLATASDEQIHEELFWFHLLRPLMNATAAEVDQELRRLAVRRHFHPEHGWRIFGIAILRSRLDEVRKVDPRELFEIARHLDALPRPKAPETETNPTLSPAGASLVELLVVLAIFAALLGITALAFKPMEAPVQVSGDLTDALLRQARARSIARTSVHRVRPLDVDSLIVESSSKCSSGAWSLEDDMTLELPQGVTISDTTWTVCFDSRGIASDNVVMAFDHPDFASRRLEVLQGGTTRWLP